MTTVEVDSVDNFICNKQSLKVRISPLVLMSIVDAYARKPRKEHRAIGTLLGHVSEGDLLEITDCFQVVHQDSADKGVHMDISYHGKVTALRQAVHPKEHVIGWFSVGEAQTIDENTISIHNFYKTKESKFQGNAQLNFTNPVYLQIDTDLREGDKPISIKVFSSEPVIGTEQNLVHFTELPICTTPTNQQGGQDGNIMEMLAYACMKGHSNDTDEPVEIRSFDAFSQQLEDLEQLFVRAKEYCQGVLHNGTHTANPEVGRALSRALAAESSVLSDEKLNDLVGSQMKDTLMVAYLSSTCKTQIVLAEKIQAILAKSAGEN